MRPDVVALEFEFPDALKLQQDRPILHADPPPGLEAKIAYVGYPALAFERWVHSGFALAAFQGEP
jgi:hypothetical protein